MQIRAPGKSDILADYGYAVHILRDLETDAYALQWFGEVTERIAVSGSVAARVVWNEKTTTLTAITLALSLLVHTTRQGYFNAIPKAQPVPHC